MIFDYIVGDLYVVDENGYEHLGELKYTPKAWSKIFQGIDSILDDDEKNKIINEEGESGYEKYIAKLFFEGIWGVTEELELFKQNDVKIVVECNEIESDNALRLSLNII